MRYNIEREQVVKLTRRLVQIPSVYRPDSGGNEEKIANFVVNRLEDKGLKVTLEEVEPGRPNVIAVLEGNKPGPTLLFEAHSDVVTEGDKEDWQHPPFEAEVEDGRIYGRGACDTKGNLAAAMITIETIKEHYKGLKGKIVLAVPVDEEGMMLGIKHFIEQGHAEDVDAAVICEPEDNQICIAQKGALRARVLSKGKMSHGSMPLTGFNPTPPLVKILAEIKRLEDDQIDRYGYNDLLGFPSITPTVVQAPADGEGQLNVMPSESEAYLDIRTIPGQNHGEIQDKLKDIVQTIDTEQRQELTKDIQEGRRAKIAQHEKLPEGISFEGKIEFLEDRPWTETNREEKIVKVISESFQELTGRQPVYNGVPGATNGTFLKSWADIPIVTTGAGDRMVPHQIDEWVSIDQLVETAKLYTATAINFCREGQS